MRETGMHCARFPARESATGFLRRSKFLVLESFPLNLLGCRGPEGMYFADEKAEPCLRAQIDQTKLDQIMVLSWGMRCARFPENLYHASILAQGYRFGCELSHSR